jgi:protein tyrosine phosphatase (PTP) superfamily phosphohydrolase (DUF442 family)
VSATACPCTDARLDDLSYGLAPVPEVNNLPVSNWVEWGTIGLLVAVSIIGLLYGYWVLIEQRLTVVTSKRVYQSAAMSPRKLIRVAKRLGIHTVFDFRGHGGDVNAERIALRGIGVRYVHIPTSPEPRADAIAAFVRAMKAEVSARRKVLMHCHDGEGRAVFFAAIYRIEFEGWDTERAYRATTRLPQSLMFLRKPFPAVGLLSPANAKTALIRGYRRRSVSARASESVITAD